MYKVFDGDGAITRVTVTSQEWSAIHRDYKVSHGGKDRRALVLCPKRGTVLVPAQITPDGRPLEESGR